MTISAFSIRSVDRNRAHVVETLGGKPSQSTAGTGKQRRPAFLDSVGNLLKLGIHWSRPTRPAGRPDALATPRLWRMESCKSMFVRGILAYGA